MRFEIFAETDNYYRVLHRENAYDYRGRKKSIAKRKFLYWKQGKIDDTNYASIKKVATKIVESRVKITDKERVVLDYLIAEVERDKYILEKDVKVVGINKAEATRTIRDEKLLDSVKLKRVRLNKELKEKLSVNVKGYPTVICEVSI